MKSLARCYVWWPKIEEDIENHVGLCEPCQQTRHAPPRAPVHPWEVTTKPWSRVHIDFAFKQTREFKFRRCEHALFRVERISDIFSDLNMLF
ncbi:hypothetical protein AVEN_244627-1 [Araneus ventricosus]|uniref:RNA-directed DNA polymerase n=1 Tax=Araneus ventricosus TaxID=182803 RepID=A0A4Y2MEU4_ARAVE|nr:hypothetical protein AVEN_244627-1 [Araneus ventricosus]